MTWKNFSRDDVSQGFAVGGFNNRSYRGTAQEGKADVYFYKDCEE